MWQSLSSSFKQASLQRVPQNNQPLPANVNQQLGIEERRRIAAQDRQYAINPITGQTQIPSEHMGPLFGVVYF
jgi:hypothetical protein